MMLRATSTTRSERVADREPAIESYRAIAVALSEAFGVTISEDAAFRLATRAHDPLPVEGYSGRSWIRPAALAEWVARNRSKASQRDDASAQVELPLEPRKPR